MGNSTVMSIIAVVLILIAELLTIIAISTNYWGETGDTYNGGTYKGRKRLIVIKLSLVTLLDQSEVSAHPAVCGQIGFTLKQVNQD